MNGTKLAGATCPVDKNRRMRNRTYGGVGGRPGYPVPYPIVLMSLGSTVLRSNSRGTRFWRFHDADYGLTGTNAREYS
jgi:hypothetical protein